MKYKIILLVSIIILLIILFGTKNEGMDNISEEITIDYNDVKNRVFPFRYFQDENGNILPIVAVTGFFRGNREKELYFKYIENGIKVIGITAYKSFPVRIMDNSEDKFHLTDDFDYLKNIKNWLCCFKSVTDYGFTDYHNIIDLSESDWYDIDEIPSTEKIYDFIYICNKDDDKCSMDGWNSINRNYDLALKCFPIMINKYNLKGLAVGRIGCDLEKLYGNKIETTDFLEWHDLQNKMRQSKFLFVPNIYDASPRVVSECLIKNIPVLMNKNILCGTKYINNETGVLFENENDIENALNSMLNKINKINPTKWWNDNYGKTKSGIRLKEYLYNLYPDLLKDVNSISFVM
jgi:hypothetical protein